MGLFSFFRKNKQESASGNHDFHSRAEEESNAVRGRSKRRPSKQDHEPADPVLPEKKRARRRLIGAVALVLAAIIGLPMFLDSEPKPLADDVTIQIPSKDKPFPPDNRPRLPPATSTPVLPVPSGLDKNEDVIEPSSLSAAPVVTTGKPQPAINSNSKPIVQAEPPTEQKQQTPSKPEAKATVQPKDGEKPNSAERANAILDGKPAIKAATMQQAAATKPGKFVIQVAALASQLKAHELQDKLKSAGVKSYTQKVATQAGERIRIRIGPFSSKVEADKMRAKIGKLGLNGTLVPA